MKRTILCSAFAVVAIATAIATQSAFSTAHKPARVAYYEGEPCDAGDGIASGYMVSTGRSGGWVCVQDIHG